MQCRLICSNCTERVYIIQNLWSYFNSSEITEIEKVIATTMYEKMVASKVVRFLITVYICLTCFHFFFREHRLKQMRDIYDLSMVFFSFRHHIHTVSEAHKSVLCSEMQELDNSVPSAAIVESVQIFAYVLFILISTNVILGHRQDYNVYY
jgi:hypothetical protein